jgi:two-component system phosphate regulon response regulator PhoB
MTHTRTVLVIEDEALLQAVLHAVLSDEGYDVLQAYDGAQGLDLATSRRPHLILLDFGLPVQSGADILARLKGRDDTRRIPVIALTGQPSPVGAEPLPLDAWLPKPFDIDALITEVDRLAGLPLPVELQPLVERPVPPSAYARRG